jgi:hypothetical protein
MAAPDSDAFVFFGAAAFAAKGYTLQGKVMQVKDGDSVVISPIENHRLEITLFPHATSPPIEPSASPAAVYMRIPAMGAPAVSDTYNRSRRDAEL